MLECNESVKVEAGVIMKAGPWLDSIHGWGSGSGSAQGQVRGLGGCGLRVEGKSRSGLRVKGQRKGTRKGG